MKFLLDSCISKFAVSSLREAKYDVIWIPETGKDPGDKFIIEKAFNEDLILVMADKDFGELVFVYNQPCPCIIRLVGIRAKMQGEILLNLIRSHNQFLKKNIILTIDKFRTRIREIEGG